VGGVILAGAPVLMKFLSIAGTAAMFLVGGSILLHGIPPLHHAALSAIESVGAVLGFVLAMVLDAVTGIVAGGVVLAGVTAVQKLRR
jgi:predicted DNA repair protein MutK